MRIFAKRVFTGKEWLENKVVETRDGKIRSVLSEDSGDRSCEILTPGYFDSHTHGGAGYDTSKTDRQGLERYLMQQAASGVTDVLPTLSCYAVPTMQKALAFLREAMEEQRCGRLRGSRIRGIHLEGPFLNPQRPGSMMGQYILPPSRETLEEIAGVELDAIRIVTMAPEVTGTVELAEWLKDRGICVQAGHTDASFEIADQAFNDGFRSLCHTFNACHPIHHRDPGVVTAALLRKEIFCEAIADLCHLHPAILRLLAELKGADHLCLISDSVRGLGMPDGRYPVEEGKEIVVTNGVSRSSTGALDGGSCYLGKSVRNLIEIGLAPETVLRSASIVPATRICLEKQIGVVQPGAEAHLTALDNSFRVSFTLIGDEVYEA